MLDIKILRENPKEAEKLLKAKDKEVDIFKILTLDENARKIQKTVDDLKARRNNASKEIAELKKQKSDASILLDEMSKISKEITNLDISLKEILEKRDFLLSMLPNFFSKDIPISDDVKDNKCIRTFKEKRNFSFSFKNHIELNEKLDLFDFEKGVKISGSGFVVYKDRGAKLEWALLNYMLDTHRGNGFKHIMPPILVKDEVLYASGQLPKFKDQSYKIDDADYKLYVIPTAEVPLNGMHIDEIIDIEQLPLKYVAYTPCFRREAGSHGKQERGLIRTHQFNKVELFGLCTPEESENIFEEILSSAESILKGLDMHYRSMLLCSSDMSFASYKTVDIEVYLPGQNRYYEVSSVSNCTDFQSRRSNIRYREKEEKPKFLHTLNGSGLATSRLMVAILENNQLEDGSVLIPEVLRKYLNNQTHLDPIS
ncbi:MAG: serine--tRNA ligase [Chlamydiae bacterium RIFCSPLOWO2_01_FULL_28_7]|nr:MAG: serine--tRNA ligase [Chlamydiae bacterium RIFCSPLOWO2_01_FULL_28_7]